MAFDPFIAGYVSTSGDIEQISFLVPPGVAEIGVYGIGGTGGPGPCYEINFGTLLSTTPGGKGDRILAGPINVTPGEMLTFVLGGLGKVPGYHWSDQRDSDDNAYICGGGPSGAQGHLPGGGGGNAGLAGGCGSSGGGGTAVLRGSLPLVVAGGGGGAGGFGWGGDAGGVGGGAAGNGGNGSGSTGGAGGAAGGSNQGGRGEPGGTPDGLDTGGGGGGGGGGYQGGEGGAHGGSGGGGGGGGGTSWTSQGNLVQLEATDEPAQLYIWSPFAPQSQDHTFVIPWTTSALA